MDLTFSPIIPIENPFAQTVAPVPGTNSRAVESNIPLSYESVDVEFVDAVSNEISAAIEEINEEFASEQHSEPVVENDVEESEGENESESGEEERESEEGLEAAVSSQTVEPDTPTVMQHNEFSARFSGASWFDTVHNFEISICGLGGIGSNAAYAISRLYPRIIYLHDFDRVDTVNMAGQMYSYKDSDKLKTLALIEKLETLSPDVQIFSYGKVDALTYLKEITVCGFDNMQARRTAYNRWKHLDGKLFIDARMNMEYFQIFCIESSNLEAMRDYEQNWLFSSSEAEATTCSQKQTTFTGMILGGMIANLIVNYANNLDFLAGKEGVIDRPLPYKTVYSSDFMTLEME